MTLQGKFRVNRKRCCNVKMFSTLKPSGGTTLVLPCCHTNTLHTLTVNDVPNLRLFLLLFVALPRCLLGGSGSQQPDGQCQQTQAELLMQETFTQILSCSSLDVFTPQGYKQHVCKAGSGLIKNLDRCM